MSYRVLLTSIFILFSITVFAQESLVKGTSVSGRVVYNKGKEPVAYATITILDGNEKVLTGAVTDEDGSFKISPVAYGNLTLRVSGIGIKEEHKSKVLITKQSPTKKVGTIYVAPATNVLEEASVVGQRQFMEMGIDKKTFNVERNITSAGGSATDVLQNIPSVDVDVDGGVSLRGKSNVTILIDGKPATLLGGDNASALQSLPAASIDQIEVVTNPSAKYDATGMTGIINIVTKRDKRFGLNGNIRAGAGTRDKYNAGLSLNLKNEKWNIFLNSNFRQNRRYRQITTQRSNKSDAGRTYSYEDNVRIHSGFFNSLGAEYRIDSNNSITLTQNLNKMRWGGNGNSIFNRFPSGNTLSAQEDRDFVWGGGPYSSSTTLDYKRKLKNRDGELTASTTYVYSWQERVQKYETQWYDANRIPNTGFVIQDAPGDGTRNSSNSQVDYSANHFTKKGKLEAGLKSQLFWLSSENKPSADSGSGPVIDSVLLNGYDYTQQIYAAYTSWGDQIGKLRYQAGLRMEYVYYEGTTTQVKGQVYTTEFLNLFPSAFVSYELPKQQSVYLSYTRRTDRPRFWQLLPYVDLSNPQDTNKGNPDLVPEFVHNLELSYNKLYDKGHNFIISGYYQYTQNLIGRYTYFYEETGRSFTQRRNLNAGVTYGLELTGTMQMVKRIWDVTLNTNLFQNKILGSSIDPTLDNSGFGWLGKLNTNVKLPWNFSFQINYNYRSPKILSQGIRKDAQWVDVALRKTFWDSKANIVLNVSDIFNTQKFTTEIDNANFFSTNYTDRETRIGNINFSYRFGGGEKRALSGRNRKGKIEDLKPDLNKDRDQVKDSEDGGGAY